MGQQELFERESVSGQQQPDPRPEFLAGELTESLDLAGARLRLRKPERRQILLFNATLDELLEPDHRARWVWQCVCQWDLSPLLREIQAVEGSCGRSHTDPRILLALWMLATLEGYGSARELERLTRHHLAYRWLCGGVSVNHNLLSEFRRTANLEELLVQMIAALLEAGVVTMEQVAVDGMKVKAAASKDSLRTKSTLEKWMADVREQLTALDEQTPTGQKETVQQTRQRQQLLNKQERLDRAIEKVTERENQQELTAKRRGQKKVSPPRASATDPDCRKMKFNNGGYGAAYNVQFTTDIDTNFVLAVGISDQPTDAGLLEPTVEQLNQQYGRKPKRMLGDGNYQDKEQIDRLENAAVEVYVPVRKGRASTDKQPNRDPHEREKRDTDAMAQWRARMGTPAAQGVYQQRAPAAEGTNAQARNRVLSQFLVHGLRACRNVVVLCALAQNLCELRKRQPQLAH